MCSEGGEVFMVPTQQGQRKPRWPTHKDPGEEKRKKKPNKGILLMVLNNGVVRGSYGHGRMGFPWMCVRVDTWFLWMAYERPMDDALMK